MEKIMNITQIDNNNSFKGMLVFNNLRKNSISTLMTDKKMDWQLTDTFQRIIVDEAQNFSTPQKCIKNLKKYVSTISKITDISFTKGYKFPSSSDVSIIFKDSKEKSQLDVPGYFSITHLK